MEEGKKIIESDTKNRKTDGRREGGKDAKGEEKAEIGESTVAHSVGSQISSVGRVGIFQ